MKLSMALVLTSFFVAYVLLVLLIGFSGPLATTIHFGRVSIAAAVLVLYVPALTTIFKEVPPPSRDYLLAGIILTWSSGVGFAMWNEAGKLWEVDTNIFTGPIAGFFSLLLVVGGIFHLAAPGAGKPRKRMIALAIGIVLGIAVVLVAPTFR